MQVATPAEIYEAPNSRFVADFIGNVNMFEGKVHGARRRASSIAAERRPDHRDRERRRRRAGSDGLASPSGRRRSGSSSTRRPTRAVNAVEGEICDIAYLGDMTVYHVDGSTSGRSSRQR